MTQVLALSITGLPFRWLTIEAAAHYVAAGKVAWALGEEAIVLHGGLQRCNGQRSRLAVPAVLALAHSEALVRHQREILPLGRDNTLLARRDRNLCAYCGEVVLPGDMTRDHVQPRARGGKDVWANVVVAHRSCNMRKGCRTPEEAGMPLLFVPYAPCRFEHFILTGRRILTDQMDYLAARLPAHSRVLS